MSFTCSKKISGLPFAHRQHNHKGHCSLIHGHNWAFEFVFACRELDACGFVVDFGDLKWLKTWLEDHFDHTLVLNLDDPMMPYIRDTLTTSAAGQMGLLPMGGAGLAEIILVPNCGAEGLAVFVFEEIDRLLLARYDGRVFLDAVVVYEDEKNSATYYAAPRCNHG